MMHGARKVTKCNSGSIKGVVISSLRILPQLLTLILLSDTLSSTHPRWSVK